MGTLVPFLTALSAVALWVLNRWHEERVRKQNAWVARRRALCTKVTRLLADFATDLEEGVDSKLNILVDNMPSWGQTGTPDGDERYQELRGPLCARAARARYSHDFESWVRFAAKNYMDVWHHPDPKNPAFPYTTSEEWRAELQDSLKLLLAALEVFLHNAHVGLIEAENDPELAIAARCDFANARAEKVTSLRDRLRDRTAQTPKEQGPTITKAFEDGKGLLAPTRVFESDFHAARRVWQSCVKKP